LERDDMGIIERASQGFSQAVAAQLNYSEKQREVVAYGAFALLHTLFSAAVVLVLGYLLGVLLPVAVMTVVAAIFRKFSGGAHCSSPNRCAFGGAFLYLLLAFVVKMAAIGGPEGLIYWVGPVCLGLSLYWTLRYAPADTPNKPIRRQETRKRLKRGAVLFLLLCTCAGVFAYLLLYNSYSQAVRAGVLAAVAGLWWQGFTLTLLGYRFMERYDSLLKRFIS